MQLAFLPSVFMKEAVRHFHLREARSEALGLGRRPVDFFLKNTRQCFSFQARDLSERTGAS
jgi:hypothetical protein